jgi:predicted RNA-binding Zn ribbon-like protein
MDAGTRTVTGSDGERYQFDPGSFCLELLLTGGPGPAQNFEFLRVPADLSFWLVESRLARTAPLVAEQFRVRPSELRQIKSFRDTMWSVARSVAGGDQPDPEHIDAVNQSSHTSMRWTLDPETAERQWVTPISGAQVLGAAARSAIEVIDSAYAHRLRECEGEDCSLLFFDASRPGNRRWCSMQRCGNRNKVQAYRSRQAC